MRILKESYTPDEIKQRFEELEDAISSVVTTASTLSIALEESNKSLSKEVWADIALEAEKMEELLSNIKHEYYHSGDEE